MIDSALFAIREHSQSLSDAEGKVAAYVIAESRRVLHYNVAELARQSGVSQAAVVRFCKRIGADSFSEFKIRLARDVFHGSDDRFLPDLELESDMSPAAVVRGVIGSLQRSLAGLESVLDVKLLEQAADAVLNADAIYAFGVAASGLVASDLYQKLMRVGIPCTFAPDTDVQITAACNLRPNDLAFVISYSGETPAMVAVAEQARIRGATVITLTMDGKNSVRELSDIPLVIPASERVYRTGAAVSRINQLTVIDILYSIIISRNLDESIAAIERTMEATHSKRK